MLKHVVERFAQRVAGIVAADGTEQIDRAVDVCRRDHQVAGFALGHWIPAFQVSGHISTRYLNRSIDWFSCSARRA